MADESVTTVPVEQPPVTNEPDNGPSDEQSLVVDENTPPDEQPPVANESNPTPPDEQPPMEDDSDTTPPADQLAMTNDSNTTPTEQDESDDTDTTPPAEQPQATDEQAPMSEDSYTTPAEEQQTTDESDTTPPGEQLPTADDSDTTPREQPMTDDSSDTTPPAEQPPKADDSDTMPPSEQSDDSSDPAPPAEQPPQADDSSDTTHPAEPPAMANDSDTNIPAERPPVPEDEKKEELKYLKFVEVMAIYAFVCFMTLYECAKENSGPLKPGVHAVEGTVKAVVKPVYDKFYDVPFQLLKFIDRKVGDTITELDHKVPTIMKPATSLLLWVLEKAPEVAREVSSEVEQAGFVDGASNIVYRVYVNYEPTAKELYNKYEPIAEKYAVSTWSTLNQLPLFPVVAHILVPTAAYWAERYNEVVTTTVERGYTVSCYLPLIPIDKIAKAFENTGSGQNTQCLQ